jgi:hypothetical protein
VAWDARRPTSRKKHPTSKIHAGRTSAAKIANLTICCSSRSNLIQPNPESFLPGTLNLWRSMKYNQKFPCVDADVGPGGGGRGGLQTPSAKLHLVPRCASEEGSRLCQDRRPGITRKRARAAFAKASGDKRGGRRPTRRRGESQLIALNRA